MDSELNKFITSLHASEYRCVLALTGAGSTALSWLLAVPGSSPEMFEKALNSNADYIFLDLEDAVSPNDKLS